MKRLEGKVAVVTGASRGLGKGIALGLGESGATVYVTGRSTREGEATFPGTIGATADEVDRLGGRGIAVRCDHRRDADVEALFARVWSEQGRLDILVNNAAGLPEPKVLWGDQRFWEVPVEIWDGVMDVGLRSHFVAAWHAVPLMIAQGSGLVVNVSSSAATVKMGLLPYSVGKAALDRMTSDMAEELRDVAVAVVSVWPPPTTTEAVVAQAEVFGDLSKWKPPLLTGRAIAALAAVPDIMPRSGKSLTVGALVEEFGLQVP